MAHMAVTVESVAVEGSWPLRFEQKARKDEDTAIRYSKASLSESS